MPTYTYRCIDCGEVLEVFQKMSDLPLKVCPECRGELKKEITGGNFQLKGKGWYKDGYSK